MKKYVPDFYYPSIYDISYEKLKQKGIQTLLFDLDNTIVEAHKKEVSTKAKQLFQKLKKEGFQILIFSNSPKKRLRIFEKQLQVEVNAMSFKPYQIGFRRVFSLYQLDKKKTAIIGDQILTDIVGGNRFGITTVLVTPITKKDFCLTKINRYFESRIYKKLEKEKLWKYGVYDE